MPPWLSSCSSQLEISLGDELSMDKVAEATKGTFDWNVVELEGLPADDLRKY